ncbi:MAG: DUF4432 family protein [Anaerolineaceae bacterium]|nr:DUF4432 family protein [Anaerolineaceae bacterium]
MADNELSLLKGFNPDRVEGAVLRPTDDMEVYVVPERGLEVLDVLIGGRPVMYRNPAGHRSRLSYNAAGLGPVKSIEGFFTAGLENAGPPEAPLPLHGTFSQTPARRWSRTETGGLRGEIDCRRMVTGPGIIVERTVEPVPGRRAFRVMDDLRGAIAGDYMWLYHPNFPIVEGTRLASSELLVAPRPDGIAEVDMARYRTFERVGEGSARWPPAAESAAAVREENFEKCYIMAVEPDASGEVRAALVAPDGESAAYVQYNVAHFHANQRAFQFWKNPRDGVSGLEVGSTFFGWTYAARHGLLCHVGKDNVHHSEIEVGFLVTKQEVDAFLARIPKVAEPTVKAMTLDELAGVYKGQALRG